MISPTAEQRLAVRAVRRWFRAADGQLTFYLAGYAGSGKSSLLPIIVEALGLQASEVAFCSPSAKAALVMTRKLNLPGAVARTIHSTIYGAARERVCKHCGGSGIDPRHVSRYDDPAHDHVFPTHRCAECAGVKSDRLYFERSETALIDEGTGRPRKKLIVADEASMIGTRLGTDLASFGIPILALGDPGQLPPVADGEFLADDPDFFLTEVHRQALDSPIIRLATDVRNGIAPAHGRMGSAVSVVRPGNVEMPGPGDEAPQVICGTHKRRWELTAAMRDSLGYGGELPLTGERVICRSNSRVHKGELVNGATLRMVQNAEQTYGNEISLRMMDETTRRTFSVPGTDILFREHKAQTRLSADATVLRRLRYASKKEEVESIDWGWAITCHNAQGSQFDDCLVVDESRAFRADRWRWLYTAVTRAAERLTLVTR